MKIGSKELNMITLGVLKIKEENGWFSFYRFGEKLETYHSSRGENVKNRALSTASVKLEFYTKGGNISFDYEISPGVLREYYSIDLTVDGVYQYNIAKDLNRDFDSFNFNIDKSEKEKRITIYFPTTARIKLKNLNIPDDFLPHRRSRNVLLMGDSGYQGYHPNHFQNTCMNVLSDALDVNMINQAIGGDCFNKDNIEKINIDVDFIMVSYGTNDWACGRFKNGEGADAYLRRLVELYPEKRILLILPPDINYLMKTKKNDDLLFENGEESYQSLEDVRNILKNISKKYDNIVTINAKNYIQQYPESFYSDNVHMTDLGNIIFANNMLKDIKKYV